MERKDLERKTKQRLYDEGIKMGIVEMTMGLRKSAMIDLILETESETERVVNNEPDSIAVQLFSPIYDPLTRRLAPGIHILPRKVAKRLLSKLKPTVIKELTPQEVAAHYGLSDGNST